MIFFVVHAHRLQVLGFEDLTTFKATDIFDAVSPRQHLGLFMVAGLHTSGRYSTILITAVRKSRVLWYGRSRFAGKFEAGPRATVRMEECRPKSVIRFVPWIARTHAAC